MNIPWISRDVKLCAQKVVVWIKRELRSRIEVVRLDLCRVLCALTGRTLGKTLVS
jgi:hypothetical protein